MHTTSWQDNGICPICLALSRQHWPAYCVTKVTCHHGNSGTAIRGQGHTSMCWSCGHSTFHCKVEVNRINDFSLNKNLHLQSKQNYKKRRNATKTRFSTIQPSIYVTGIRNERWQWWKNDVVILVALVACTKFGDNRPKQTKVIERKPNFYF